MLGSSSPISESTGQSFPGQNSVVEPASFLPCEEGGVWRALCVDIHLSQSVLTLRQRIPARISPRVLRRLPLFPLLVTLRALMSLLTRLTSGPLSRTGQDWAVLTSNQERQHNIWIPPSQSAKGKLQSLHTRSVSTINGHKTDLVNKYKL